MLSRKNKMGPRSASARNRNRQVSGRRTVATDTEIRVCTGALGVITTTAAGIIAPTAVASGAVFGSSTEFASYAARFDQYRVKKLKIYFIACHPEQVPTATDTADHGALFVGQSEMGAVVGTGQQVMSLYKRQVRPTYASFSFTGTWDRNPNCKLWSQTNAVPAGTNQFSVQWGTPAFANNAVVASTDYFSLFAEWTVEFRGEM